MTVGVGGVWYAKCMGMYILPKGKLKYYGEPMY